MYTLRTTKSFLRQARLLFRGQPELKKRFSSISRQLMDDPFQPRLRLHPLQGPLQGIYAVRLTYKYRIVLTCKPAEREIVLLDVGSHDEVYR
ncbi:MAG: plasmid stabilization protein [Planctomycetes bacterium RBG_16_59_8]|nr:MAG: plasmid stabilization protein [Planctomycetes bacterium RBG_16_59_8]